MRKLASIQEIASIAPIEGKDRIALATVVGWTVIIQKSQFEVGDRCVYIEPDAVLPQRDEFEFLRSKGFRVKTMKMSGCISQGICFPLSILPEGIYDVGDDVTDILGVKQYEPTMDKEQGTAAIEKKPWWKKLLGGKQASTEFPSFINKTDETRIQNVPFFLECKDPMIVTEKLDGQSGTFVLLKKKWFIFGGPFEYMVCSRNRRIPQKDNSSYWSVSEKYDIKNGLSFLFKSLGAKSFVAIQGECVGPSIQKNKYSLKEYELYVFNIIVDGKRLDPTKTAFNCTYRLNVPTVPILSVDYTLPDTVSEMLDYAHGESRIGKKGAMREGLVVRSQDGSMSFKAVDPLFLLKYDE